MLWALTKNLLSQKKPYDSKIWETVSHRFPNAWEYFFPVHQKKKKRKIGNTHIFLTHVYRKIFPVFGF